MSDVVLPPATGTWWDLEPTLAAVLHTLRLSAADVDVPVVESSIEAAARQIDQYLDSSTVVATAPPDVHLALHQLAAALYRRKDAPLGTLGGVEGPSLLLTDENAIATVEPLLRPYRRRWGIA